MTSLDISQAQMQDFDLAHPNFYSNDELLECMKESALQIQNYKISMTQSNTRYLKGVPVRFYYR